MSSIWQCSQSLSSLIWKSNTLPFGILVKSQAFTLVPLSHWSSTTTWWKDWTERLPTRCVSWTIRNTPSKELWIACKTAWLSSKRAKLTSWIRFATRSSPKYIILMTASQDSSKSQLPKPASCSTSKYLKSIKNRSKTPPILPSPRATPNQNLPLWPTIQLRPTSLKTRKNSHCERLW